VSNWSNGDGGDVVSRDIMAGGIPVTGASGGAMRRPPERMPHQLVSLEPCQSSARLPRGSLALKVAASPSRSTSKACSREREYDECVDACVSTRYCESILCSDEATSIGVSFALSWLYRASIGWVSKAADLVSRTREASSMLPSASTISIFAFRSEGVEMGSSFVRVPLSPVAVCGMSV
jgi:hypothetical protein